MTVAYFTPSMNDPALLEQIFVAREPLAKRLLSRIRDSVETESRHYSLVVGSRGIGKTHLVSVIYYRIKNDPVLSKSLYIAWLNEDPYSVSSYARFLREVLGQLDREYGLPDWAEQLSAIQDMERDEDKERALQSVILRHLSGRLLLIIAENLDSILEGLGDEGQKKLRAFLQTSQPATLLATSTSLTPDIEDRGRPFFGFFNEYELQSFTFQECIDVLVRIALYQKDEQLAAFLRSAPARGRIRAVHHIAGGNPRIYVVFFQFLTCQSLDGLIEPFMKLVNELVPYYQSRMQTISPQQRMLVDIVCRHESPIAVRDIAKSAFISPQSASSDCGKLRSLGYFTSTKVGRESLYELREPLMRICLAAKEQRGQSLPLFIDFLRIWFTPSELTRFNADFAHRAHDDSRYRDIVREAKQKHHAQVSFSLQAVRTREAEGDKDGALALLRNLYQRSPNDDLVWSEYFAKLAELNADSELVEVSQERVADSDSAEAWNDLSYALSLAGDKNGALDAAVKATDRANSAPFWFRRFLILKSLGRDEEALAASQNVFSLIEDPKSYLSAFIIGRCRFELAEYAAAAAAFIDVITAFDQDYQDWRYLHRTLDLMHLDRSRLRVSEFVTLMFPDNPLVWRDYATALSANGDFERALIAIDRAIALTPSDPAVSCQRLVYVIQSGDRAAVEVAAKHAAECLVELQGAMDPGTLADLATWQAINGDEAVARRTLAIMIDKLKASNDIFDIRRPMDVLFVTSDAAALARVVDTWSEAFFTGGALSHLGVALVKAACEPRAIPLHETSADALQRWVELWQSVAARHAALVVPARLLDVVVRFFRTRDPTLLLELPVEQRELLENELRRHKLATGDERHELDELIERLIASARSHVLDGSLLSEQLPEKLPESERTAQPSVVLLAGAATYAGLPVTASPKSLIDRFATAPAVRSIKNIDAFSIAGLRVAEMPWLGGHLAFLPHRNGEVEVPFFVSDKSVVLATRINDWIYAAKDGAPPPRLDENLIAYVRFFFTTVAGRQGAFRFVERLDDVMWLSDATDGVKKEFEQKLHPLSLVGTNEDGRLELRGTVTFKNALFITSVLVAANWQVALAKEVLLIDDLPIKFGEDIDLLVRR